MKPFDILAYDTLDSTNEEAKRLLALDKISRLTLIVTRHQTTGRGTHGRPWISPPGAGLCCSIVHPYACLTDNPPPENQSPWNENPLPLSESASSLRGGPQGRRGNLPFTPLFTLAAGLACADALLDGFGLDIALKPINDLYMHNCKLGGILTESLLGAAHGQTTCRAIVTGIGVNILAHEDVRAGCAADVRGNVPISLSECLPPHVLEHLPAEMLADELAQSLTQAVDARYRQLASGDIAEILSDYQARKLPSVPLPQELHALLSKPAPTDIAAL